MVGRKQGSSWSEMRNTRFLRGGVSVGTLVRVGSGDDEPLAGPESDESPESDLCGASGCIARGSGLSTFVQVIRRCLVVCSCTQIPADTLRWTLLGETGSGGSCGFVCGRF
mmetsp:Transcript_101938/g.164336  ORF Transcript_101938/g.164336 Transcript_101938/m.164336 type:complete len:111 (+) Transcript_101938:203-535(+)